MRYEVFSGSERCKGSWVRGKGRINKVDLEAREWEMEKNGITYYWRGADRVLGSMERRRTRWRERSRTGRRKWMYKE